MIKKMLLLIAMVIGTSFFYSQQIEVSVKNGKDKFNEGVNVQLIKDGKTLNFQKTNSEGKCYFSPKEKGAFSLKFTSVFFKTKIIQINTESQSIFKVELEEQITEIETVAIKPPSKIVFLKNDTLKYNINAIKDGTERTTEDLIKKLPGLDFNTNGKVTYKGKAIGQILVENSEFFGKNHSIATQNISSNMIDGIELWKDYTTLNGNSSTALNLKLKDEYKGRITGNVQVNNGTNNSYLAHSNMFQFSKLGNFAFISDFNNIAIDPISFMDYLDMNTQENIENDENQTIAETPSFLNNDGKVNSKNNQFGALQYSKSNKKFTIAAFSIFNNSQLTKQIFTSRDVLNGQVNTLNFLEQRSENNDGFIGTTQIKLKYNFTNKNFLYYNFGFNPLEDNFQQNTFRQSEKNYTFDISENIKKTNLNNFISWNTELKNSKITFAFSQVHEKFYSNLSLKSDENLSLFYNVNALYQQYEINSDKYSLDFYLKNKNKFFDFKFNSGFSNKQEKLNSSEIILNTIENKILHTFQYVNSISLSKNLARFSFSGAISSKFFQFYDVEQHYFEKNLSMKYMPKSKVNSEFEISYNSSVSTPTLKILNSNPIFTRDLTFYENESLLPEFMSYKNNYQFSWSRFNFSKGNFFFFIFQYENLTPFVTTNVINSGAVSGVKNTIGSQQNRWLSHLILENRFLKNYIFKTKLLAVLYKTPDFINNIENISTITNVEISQILTTNFKNKPFQFEVGYSFSKNNFSQSFFNTDSAEENLKLLFGVRANIKKEWIGNVLGEYLVQRAGQNKRKNFLVGGQISYKKDNTNFEYSLLFNNLLHLNSFSYINSITSQFGKEESSTTALRGYILGGIKYYF